MFLTVLGMFASFIHGLISFNIPGTGVSILAVMCGLTFFPIMVRVIVKLFSASEGVDHARIRSPKDE